MIEHNALSSFLRQLYDIEPLTIEEEAELAKQIQKGDDEARDKLVIHNLRFIPYNGNTAILLLKTLLLVDMKHCYSQRRNGNRKKALNLLDTQNHSSSDQ